MGAKQKLNAAHVNGAVIVAGLVGWVTGSLALFVFTLLVLVTTSFIARDIR
jgi:hypothetical protein